jgi:lipopolysaccharide transport system ATP-binding protein
MGTITITNLGKAYKHKWVLQGVTFSVNPGEAVGIIGVNGAGKSTLLKMITGTTQPTTGSVHMTGRVAAMLELGMGFHPDFTGRQNAYMAGQLLGYTAEDITRLLPVQQRHADAAGLQCGHRPTARRADRGRSPVGG